jgi:raffinose/stachyose/melibiose transport system substrate-binding protein
MPKKLTIIILCLLLCLGCGLRREDPNTITVWHWMTDRDKALRELAERYEEETGVKVKIDLFAPSDAYSKKITASAQAGILPDIFGVLDTKTTFADFIRYGFVADLTAAFEKDNGRWKGIFHEKALRSDTFEEGNTYHIKPGIYGVPLDVTTIELLYNKKLLATAGYQEPPKTFEEFLKVGQALRRVGIPGMVSGWGETWLIECFAMNYAFNIMGEEKLMATFRGEVPYTDKDWLEVFGLFRALVQNDILIEGVVSKPNKEAEQDFALQRAAFAFNGSWSVNVYREMNPELSYGVILPPPINPDLPMRIWGGAGSSFVVSGNSPRKENAIAFLRWLTEKERQEYLLKATNNLPSNREVLMEVPEALEEFARGLQYATHPTAWEREEAPLVKERLGKGLQAILLGKKTPEAVAVEVQEVKVREMEKLKRRR